jgi:hypothetical protein
LSAAGVQVSTFLVVPVVAVRPPGADGGVVSGVKL